MKKTPQDFKREEVREVFDKILKGEKTLLTPVSITASESLEHDFTETAFSFEHKAESNRVVSIKERKGKGFVDGLFRGLHNHFVPDCPSLERIKLVDLIVNPSWATSRNSLGSDVKATVLFRVNVMGHGTSSFHHCSRSMIYSSFVATLNAFQFYINCERSFHKIQTVIDDGSKRNRFDIVDKWKFQLSKLTGVNTYVQRIQD